MELSNIIKQDDKGLLLLGEVIEILPNLNFKIKLQNEMVVLAHASGKIRKNRIRIILYDKVAVRISNADIENLNKKDALINARLEYRYKQ